MAFPRQPAAPPGVIINPVLMPCTGGGTGDNGNPYPRRDIMPAPTGRAHRRYRRRPGLRHITSPQEPAVTALGYAHTSRRNAQREVAMARCETCGNDYDKAFQVSMNGTTHTFDSFECAIHALAPTCENCGIRIVGHGLKGRHVLLLRALRRGGRRHRIARPHRCGGLTRHGPAEPLSFTAGSRERALGLHPVWMTPA